MSPDITADCVENRISPTMELKAIVLVTPAATATNDTIDVKSFGIKKILNTYLQNATGTQVDNPTWSGTEITMPTLTTGVHHLLIIGEC